MRYRNYIFVPLPSYKARDKERGFNHIEEILKFNDLPYLNLLKKDKDIKQSSLSKEEREQEKNLFSLNETIDLSNKKICLIDDVITTGSSMRQALRLIRFLKPKKITFLALSHLYIKKKLVVRIIK